MSMSYIFNTDPDYLEKDSKQKDQIRNVGESVTFHIQFSRSGQCRNHQNRHNITHMTIIPIMLRHFIIAKRIVYLLLGPWAVDLIAKIIHC